MCMCSVKLDKAWKKVEGPQLPKLLSPKCSRERAAGTFHFNNLKAPVCRIEK